MPILPLLPTRRRDRSGQGLVEFAITLPILIFLLVVALHYGIIIWVSMNIASSCREAALYGAYQPDSDQNISNAVQVGLPSFLDPNHLTITISDSGDRNKGSSLTISINYDLAGGGMDSLPCGELLPAPNNLVSQVTIPIVAD